MIQRYVKERPVNTGLEFLLKNLLNQEEDYFSVADKKPNYPVDVWFDNSKVVIEIPIVGGDIDDIDITSSTKELSVKYHKTSEPDLTGVTQVTKGITRRNFELSWKVDLSWDVEKISSTYMGGLLRIEIPFKKEALPTKIEIKNN